MHDMLLFSVARFPRGDKIRMQMPVIKTLTQSSGFKFGTMQTTAKKKERNK